MDDTVQKGAQAEEETLMARLRAGLLPGQESITLESLESLETLHEQARSLGDKGLMVYNVDRSTAEGGAPCGAVGSLILLGLPENVHGRVILSFEGWADDPREVYDIPEIVDYCQGFLLGMSRNDREHAQRVLSILLPEHEEGIREDGSIDQMMFQAPGALFLVGCCYPDKCWSMEKGRIMRDLRANIAIFDGFFPAITEA